MRVILSNPVFRNLDDVSGFQGDFYHLDDGCARSVFTRIRGNIEIRLGTVAPPHNTTPVRCIG